MAQEFAVLEKEFRSYKEKTTQDIHDIQIKNTRIEAKVDGIEQSMNEILENSRWMKRAWTKGIITLVISVSSTLIVGLGGLIWWLATK